jgi:hypothetical protein
MGKTKSLRDRASGVVDSLAPHVETARSKAGPAFSDARDKAAPVLSDVAAKAGPALSDARDRAADALGGARDKAGPVLADARDKAGPIVAPVVASVRDKAGPVLADARDKASPVVAPVVADVRERFTHDVLPVLTAAWGAVDSATEDARADAAERGGALADSVRERVSPTPKKHPIRNLLISLTAGAITFAVVRRLADRNRAAADWQTAYTPPPAPANPTVDTAAAGPGEAVADATDVPHGTTTPDNPVVDIDVDPQR